MTTSRALFLGFVFLFLTPFFAFAQASPHADVIKKSEDILTRVLGLSKEIKQIDTDVKAAILPGQVEIVGSGDDASSPVISFSKQNIAIIPLFDSVEKTLVVRNKSNRPISSKNLQGLAGAFSFKGGRYPGTGGTCKEFVAKGDCTLVVLFDPKKGEGAPYFDQPVLRYRVPSVKLEYGIAKKNLESNAITLDGKAYLASDVKFKFTYEEAESVLAGDSKDVIVVDIYSNDRDKQLLVFKDVTFEPPAVPFSVRKNTCVAGPLKECQIHIVFAPVSEGSFPLNLNFSVNNGKEIQKEKLSYTGSGIADAEGLNPSKHVLVVYNEDWAESVEAKNYYLANRPRFSTANVFGVHFPVTPKCSSLPCLSEVIELTPYPRLQTQVLNPIIGELVRLSKLPGKDIQYVVLMSGLPTRPDEATVSQRKESLQFMIRNDAAKELSKEVFVTSLDTGSLEAMKAYIDKLKSVYALMPVKSPVISAQGTNKAGTTYYFSDAFLEWNLREDLFEGGILKVLPFSSALKSANPSARIITRGYSDPLLSSASDVTGLLMHGAYVYGKRQSDGTYTNGDYAINGSINFTGKSGWYAMTTVESFNGLWMGSGWQGTFIKWFSANAFGGSNYSNTPAAALTYNIEFSDKAVKPSLFVCWEEGKPFAYCAWESDVGAQVAHAVGDPWVTR